MKFSEWWARDRERQRLESEEHPMARTIRDEDDDGEETSSFEDVVALRATDKALLCRIDGDEHWVPRSQVHDNSEVYENGHSGKLVVRSWWAKKVGIA